MDQVDHKPKKLNVQFITNSAGKKQSVIMPVKDYEELMEDYKDLVLIASRKDDQFVPLKEAFLALQSE